jgi:hypothetical protein
MTTEVSGRSLPRGPHSYRLAQVTAKPPRVRVARTYSQAPGLETRQAGCLRSSEYAILRVLAAFS